MRRRYCFKGSGNKDMQYRCSQCTQRTKDPLTGEFTCPHGLLPVMGMECFRKKPVTPPPEVKPTAVRVRARRVRSSMRDVVEMCPHCKKEITMQWDVQHDGYETRCPACGERLMLCTECIADGGSCDYNSYNDDCCRMGVKNVRVRAYRVTLYRSAGGHVFATSVSPSQRKRAAVKEFIAEMGKEVLVYVMSEGIEDAKDKTIAVYKRERSLK